MILVGEDRVVANWVAIHIPHMAARVDRFPPGEAFGMGAAIGVLNSHGEIVGGVVYHNWDEDCRSIELSCASTTKNWLTREDLRMLLRYPFGQLHCQRVTACTPRRATSARRFLEKLGFKREGCVRRGFGVDHAIVYGLLAEEWAESPLNRPPRRRSLTYGEKVRPDAAALA